MEIFPISAAISQNALHDVRFTFPCDLTDCKLTLECVDYRAEPSPELLILVNA